MYLNATYGAVVVLKFIVFVYASQTKCQWGYAVMVLKVTFARIITIHFSLAKITVNDIITTSLVSFHQNNVR